MIAASIVSRKTMKKIVTENRSFAMMNFGNTSRVKRQKSTENRLFWGYKRVTWWSRVLLLSSLIFVGSFYPKNHQLSLVGRSDYGLPLRWNSFHVPCSHVLSSIIATVKNGQEEKRIGQFGRSWKFEKRLYAVDRCPSYSLIDQVLRVLFALH